MKDESTHPGGPVARADNASGLPTAVDRTTFQAELDRLRVREKAHTREADAIAAARRRLPMVEVAELAEAGTPFTERMRGDYPGISAFLSVGDAVYHTYSTFGRGIEEFHYGIPYLDLTALGRQEPWEQPKGRAIPLGLHAGGPRLRFPDEYDA
jgi:predicted dithiol-disulfide oxidoreductase (DUF899 family)